MDHLLFAKVATSRQYPALWYVYNYTSKSVTYQRLHLLRVHQGGLRGRGDLLIPGGQWIREDQDFQRYQKDQLVRVVHHLPSIPSVPVGQHCPEDLDLPAHLGLPLAQARRFVLADQILPLILFYREDPGHHPYQQDQLDLHGVEKNKSKDEERHLCM